MEDYKEEIRNILKKYYYNAGEDHKMIHRTTSQILEEVRGVIPQHPIDEHDIYEIMKAMYFEQEQKIFYEKACTFEGNEERSAEYEQKETGRIIVWKLYQM